MALQVKKREMRKDHFLEEYQKILKQWREDNKSIICLRRLQHCA